MLRPPEPDDPVGPPLSPLLGSLAAYPFARMRELAESRRRLGLELIDLGTGDPQEPTDPAIVAALRDAIHDRMGYPAVEGLPELREAISTWVAQRFAVDLDPARAVIPTLGSKEAIYSFAQLVLDPGAGKDTVVVPDPGYPVYARGARFAGGSVHELPLLERVGFLPDLDAVPEEVWRRSALVWVSYPNNPTCACAPLSFYERLADLARAFGFVVASDEAYSEIWFDEPPRSALELADLANVVVFNTLSKRSAMTGFHSGFVAGDPLVIDALKRFRPSLGTVPQEFVQRASIVAWGDESHVERARAEYGAKRRLFLELFERRGFRVAGSEATMFLWVATPAGESSEAFAARLLEVGIFVTPGAYLGQAGEGYVRFALVASLEECQRAVELLDETLRGA